MSVLLKQCEHWVKDHLQHADGSHDWQHVQRVRTMALQLAAEGKIVDTNALLTIEIAALLHDILDWKYSGSTTAGPQRVHEFLSEVGASPQLIMDVEYIVSHMSYHSGLMSNAMPSSLARCVALADCSPDIESWLHIVQDADRLDAMGCIGIARAFMYGGAKKKPIWLENHPLSQPEALTRYIDQETYLTQQAPDVLGHFYEKLLRLYDTLVTDAGRRHGQPRHRAMVRFVEMFRSECRPTLPAQLDIKNEPLHWITHDIAISDISVGSDLTKLAQHDIGAVVCVQPELPMDEKKYNKMDILLHHIPIIDADVAIYPWIPEALQFMDRAIRQQHRNVLVHCTAGVSCSTTFVIAYLMKHKKWTADVALAYIQDIRPCAEPNWFFMNQLRQWTR